jgi:hypothetical protein
MADPWVPEPGSVVRSEAKELNWYARGVVIEVDDKQRVWCWWDTRYRDRGWAKGFMPLESCRPYKGNPDTVLAAFTAWRLVNHG